MIIYSIRYYIDNNGRKRCVIDLYFNQRKTYAEIAEIEMMSIRDLSAILKEEESPLKALQDILHNRIKQKKAEIHESHSEAYTGSLSREIETLH
jgi:hypothetical protein